MLRKVDAQCDFAEVLELGSVRRMFKGGKQYKMNMYTCLCCHLREVKATYAESDRPFTQKDREEYVKGFTAAWRQGWMVSCPALGVDYDDYHEDKPNYAVYVPETPPDGCKFVMEHVVGGKDDD